jgi:beta-carotene hydroxylase
VNDWILSLIELLALRSGHAYQAAHLHHHARYPHRDDVEGAAARMSFPRALAEGVNFPYRIWLWAIKHTDRGKAWLYGEGIACLALVTLAIFLAPITPVILVYVILIIMGAWLNPLITAYLPHEPDAKEEIFQTRVFRGVVASLVAWEHLYHLEHHLFPAVPHHNWPKLAKRLDPFLEEAGIKPIKFWF